MPFGVEVKATLPSAANVWHWHRKSDARSRWKAEVASLRVLHPITLGSHDDRPDVAEKIASSGIVGAENGKARVRDIGRVVLCVSGNESGSSAYCEPPGSQSGQQW